ncbi:MAG: LOG family protein [Myxococcota bacterium]
MVDAQRVGSPASADPQRQIETTTETGPPLDATAPKLEHASTVTPTSGPRANGSPNLDSRQDCVDRSWQCFVGRAKSDVVALDRNTESQKPSVVILGGDEPHGPMRDTHAVARSLGSALAKAGWAIRTADRPGATADLVQAARGEKDDIHIEAVGFDDSDHHRTGATIRASTLELGLRLLSNRADAFVVMPGGLHSLWEFASVWTLARAGKIPKRDIVLVGSRDYWNAFLPQFIDAGITNNTIKPCYLNHEDGRPMVHFVDTTAEAMSIIGTAEHAGELHDLEDFAPKAVRDLEVLPAMMRKFKEAAVIYGGAGLKPEQAEYRFAETFGRLATCPKRTGGGPGAMEAPLKGAKQSATPDGQRREAINIILPSEQATNPHTDPEFTEQGETLEIRERMLMEKALCHVFVGGGTGTLVELFQVWQLMALGEIPERPIMVSPYYKDFVEAFKTEALRCGYLTDRTANFVQIYESPADMAAAANAVQRRRQKQQRVSDPSLHG